MPEFVPSVRIERSKACPYQSAESNPQIIAEKTGSYLPIAPPISFRQSTSSTLFATKQPSPLVRAPKHSIYTHDVSRNRRKAQAREEARQVQQSAAWGWAKYVRLFGQSSRLIADEH